MKLLTIIFALFFMFPNLSIIAQNTAKDSIVSLKLNKKGALKFQKGLRIKGLKVDKEGVLRPDKGYEIVRMAKKKKFLVKPVNMELNMSGNFDSEEMPDGSTMVCHCGFGAGDNCAIGEIQLGDGPGYWNCEGGCDCGVFFLELEENVSEYQTLTGF